MYEIHVMDMEFERCSEEKEKLNLIVPYTVLHFIISGEGFINGNRVSENTVFINYRESYMNYYPSKDNPWSYIYIRLLGDDMENVFQDYDFESGLTILPFYKKNELFNLLALYNSFCGYDNFEARKIIANAVLLLFEKKTVPVNAAGVQEQNAGNIKKFIDDNFYKKLTVKLISEKFFLSRDYIRNLFVKFYGVPPKQYIQIVRMERAKKLLTETDTSISVIAGSVGYDDSLLFSKMFKKYYSVSPKKYRDDLREKRSKGGK